MSGFDPRYAFRARRSCRRSLAGGYFVSFFIIVIGVAMLLDTLGIVPARSVWDYFPLLFAAFGIVKIFQSEGRAPSLVLGGILTVGGCLWFLQNIGFLPFDSRFIPPLAVIAVGFLFLVRSFERQRETPADTVPATAEGHLNIFTVFGGVKRFVDAPDFQRADIFAMFGGIELDLRGAKIVNGTARIEANALFGGIEIRVPQNWSVELQGVGIFGGYEDKTIHPIGDENAAPKVVIRGSAMFGGVSVANA